MMGREGMRGEAAGKEVRNAVSVCAVDRATDRAGHADHADREYADRADHTDCTDHADHTDHAGNADHTMRMHMSMSVHTDMCMCMYTYTCMCMCMSLTLTLTTCVRPSTSAAHAAEVLGELRELWRQDARRETRPAALHGGRLQLA